MVTCRACGAENPDRARFCLDCGVRLVAPVSDQTSRRTVTILFSDIVGSTELGEQLDPEALRAVLGEYFAAMRVAIERHAGTVEKFIGDAIMAVFGLSAIHEDDALRAVRAAAEMRDALADLNVELQRRRGVVIAMRVGVNTGEVVAGDPSARQTMVTGDTVNTAARLEQAAGTGEILLGLTTWQLVRHAVLAEEIPPFPAKGKAGPLAAMRLLSVDPAAGRRAGAVTTSLVGRDAEMTRLATIFDGVVRDRIPALVTIVGPAGVGKTRLTESFVEAVADQATVLRGQCLSYGEGITYWPIREILLTAAGIRDGDTAQQGLARLGRLVRGARDAATIAARLASVIGLSAESFSQAELFWAVRRALERLSAARPLVLVIDDIHWAEPTLVELIDHIVRQSRDAPILVLCPARDEILDRASEQVPAGSRSVVMRIEGLPGTAMTALIDELPGGSTIAPHLRQRILTTVEGNPLFLEEMVRLVVEEGEGATFPPSIQALLAARIDALPLTERGVAQRASVAGRVFEEVAVVALTPPAARPEITASLLGLVRREVVAPEHSRLTSDEAYRFRHVLLRDAAYEALPKADRADLHRRFVDWLEQAAGDRLMEYEEILGYHLGQAYGYRLELRENDALTETLGARAATYLGAAGKRAADRGDGLAACRLLEQAIALPAPDARARARWQVELAISLQGIGRIGEARLRAHDALRQALAAGDRAVAARARVALVDLRQAEGTLAALDPAIRTEIGMALEDAEAVDDELALAEVHDALGRAAWNEGHNEESDAETRLAVEHARAAGEIRFALATEMNLLVAVFAGPTPASQVAVQAEALAGRAADYPTLRADAISLQGISEAMLGRFEEAHRHLDEAIATLVDLAATNSLVNVRTYKAWIHRLAGEWAAAEAVLRLALAEAEGMGDLGFTSFVSCRLAEVLVAQERYDDAEAVLVVAERSPIAATRSRIHGARARIKAARGDPSARQEVEPLIAMAAEWPWPNVRAEALRDAAFVMRDVGDRDAARAFAVESAELSRAKENLALASQMDELARTL